MAALDAREMLVHRWVSGSFSNPGELVRHLRAAGIPCDGRQRYLGLIVRIDSYRNQRQRLGMERLYQARQTLLELCSSVFPRGYCCVETDTYIAAVLIGQGYISPETITEPIKRLRQQMDAQFGISLTVGIGTHAAMPADVAESVRNAHIAARYRLVYGSGQTIRYESIAARVGQSPTYPDEEFRAVLSAFERGDSAEFERRLSVLFTACYSQSVQFGLSAVSHLLVELYRCLPPAMQAECDLVGVSTQLGECDHISQQMRIIRSFGLNAIEGRLNGAQPERYKDQFSVIMAYVAEHYTNPDLSITAIAEHAGLSANTVRMLFRENGLSSPKDYIQKLRMECACRLLETTSLSAREIGERVGFVESRYFYQVFKKYTGKTAFEYRASLSFRPGS